jgi:hypothetical protein
MAAMDRSTVPGHTQGLADRDERDGRGVLTEQ